MPSPTKGRRWRTRFRAIRRRGISSACRVKFDPGRCRKTCLAAGSWPFARRSGRLAILDARCSHLHADLGNGRVVGDTVQCPYHHWRYGGDGRCVHIPASREIPSFAPPAIVSGCRTAWPGVLLQRPAAALSTALLLPAPIPTTSSPPAVRLDARLPMVAGRRQRL